MGQVRNANERKRLPSKRPLLGRVFREDVLSCPCGDRRVVLAYLTQKGR